MAYCLTSLAVADILSDVTVVFQCYSVVLLEYSTDLWFSNDTASVYLLSSKVSNTYSVFYTLFCLVIHKNNVSFSLLC